MRTPITLTLAAAAAALAAGSAGAASPTCRLPKQQTSHWQAVFGHFSKAAEADALVHRLAKAGFSQARIENRGCGDLEVKLAGLDTPKMRADFTKEAVGAGFQVSYETPGGSDGRQPKGTWKAVFGTVETVDQASELQRRIAQVGFRINDVEYLGPGRWRVVVAAIPVKESRAFGREAKSAGFTITYSLT
jgi:hypothetical protein